MHNTTWSLEMEILLEMKEITFSKRASSLCCKFWVYYTKEYPLIFELCSQFFPSRDFRPTLVSGSLRMRVIAFGSMYFVLGYEVYRRICINSKMQGYTLAFPFLSFLKVFKSKKILFSITLFFLLFSFLFSPAKCNSMDIWLDTSIFQYENQQCASKEHAKMRYMFHNIDGSIIAMDGCWVMNEWLDWLACHTTEWIGKKWKMIPYI